jgi:HEPN domain-containing protein
MTRKELQILSGIRLREARALAKLGMNDGAYYLAGYSVECSLKACIAKATFRHDFPDKERAIDSYSHNFGKLLRVAGLAEALQEDAQSDPMLRQNWIVVQLWSPEHRYKVNNFAAAR